MIKKTRHSAILDLIAQKEVYTQEELTELLNERGYDVSQSTVSRDINELNLIKAESKNGKSKYVKALDASSAVSPNRMSILKQSTLSIDVANNIIVVKTLSGHANAVALIIDEMNFPQVLGSVAGDDAVLIVAKTNAEAEVVMKSLRTL